MWLPFSQITAFKAMGQAQTRAGSNGNHEKACGWFYQGLEVTQAGSQVITNGTNIRTA